MKILYAIQGTGNGHVSRAREIIPHLRTHGNVDLLLSGTQADVALDEPIKYRFLGFGFVFGKKGGVSLPESWKALRSRDFIRDCRSLPVQDYDLVINDFEPVCAWACKFRKKKNVALSHQSAYLSPKTPQLPGFHWGRAIMQNYAPTDAHIGFHFQRYDSFIHTPVIRRGIRDLKPENLGHYTVYLPAYSDEFILRQVRKYPEISWHVFSKHSDGDYETGSVQVFKINNEKFNNSVASCEGLLTGGGFEGPAEALFLGKKVLAVPMKNQYEQQCNALGLEKLGVPVIWHESEFSEKLRQWILSDRIVAVDFPDETREIIAGLVHKYGGGF